MFQVESRADATLVNVYTEIDGSVEGEFHKVLLLASHRSAPLIVSLVACPYIDCAGLSVLIKIRNGMRFPMSVVLRGDTFLLKLFATAGLLRRLDVSVIGAVVAAA